MSRTGWSRLRKGQVTALAAGGTVALLAVIGAIVYLNVLERESLAGEGGAGSGQAAPLTSSASQEVAGAGVSSDPESPGDWVSFAGRTVSLELPDWFVGGVPEDARARGALESVIGMDLAEWFDLYAQSTLEQSELELLMAGASRPDGRLIVVTAEVEALPATSSLEVYADELGGWYSDGVVSVQMVGEERAHVRFGFLRADESAEAMAARVALVRSPGGVLMVSYTAPAQAEGTLDSVFQASAGTIMVRE